MIVVGKCYFFLPLLGPYHQTVPFFFPLTVSPLMTGLGIIGNDTLRTRTRVKSYKHIRLFFCSELQSSPIHVSLFTHTRAVERFLAIISQQDYIDSTQREPHAPQSPPDISVRPVSTKSSTCSVHLRPWQKSTLF